MLYGGGGAAAPAPLNTALYIRYPGPDPGKKLTPGIHSQGQTLRGG